VGKTNEVIEENRRMIESKWFKEQYRKKTEAFSRIRKLSFPIMIVLILQKSVKSLQLRLNEYFDKLSTSTSTGWGNKR
jgi:hypothetical protein